MKQQTPAFNSTQCAFHQLFKVFEQLHPNEAAAFSPPGFILFIELAANAIASELAEKERTGEGVVDICHLVNNARKKLVRLLDILYRYRNWVGKKHPYADMYLQGSNILKSLLLSLDSIYGEICTDKLKITDEELATLKPQFMRRLNMLTQRMQQAGLSRQWVDVCRIPLTDSIRGKNNTDITWHRWSYLTGLGTKMEKLSLEDTFSETTLIKLLLENNFNSQLLREAYAGYMVQQMEELDLAAKINLLKTARAYVEYIKLPGTKGLFPNDLCVKKQLKRWINYQLQLYYREQENETGVLETIENRDAGKKSKRISLDGHASFIGCLFKVFFEVGFILDKELKPVLELLSRFIRLPKTLTPSALNLVQNASRFNIEVLEQVIKFLQDCQTTALKMKKKMETEERRKAKAASGNDKT